MEKRFFIFEEAPGFWQICDRKNFDLPINEDRHSEDCSISICEYLNDEEKRKNLLTMA